MVNYCDYLRVIDEDKEQINLLLEGAIFPMRRPNWKYGRVAHKLGLLLEYSKKENHIIYADSYVYIDDDNCLRPSFVVCKSKLDFDYESPVLNTEYSTKAVVVIDIITNKEDLELVARFVDIYSTSNVKEYWVLDTLSHRMYVHNFNGEVDVITSVFYEDYIVRSSVLTDFSFTVWNIVGPLSVDITGMKYSCSGKYDKSLAGGRLVLPLYELLKSSCEETYQVSTRYALYHDSRAFYPGIYVYQIGVFSPDLVIDVRDSEDFQPKLKDRLKSYKEEKVKQYICIDLISRKVTSYDLIDGNYEQTRYKMGDVVCMNILPDIEISVARLLNADIPYLLNLQTT